MRNVTDLLDGTRPVTMNHLITNPAEAYLDMCVPQQWAAYHDIMLSQ